VIEITAMLDESFHDEFDLEGLIPILVMVVEKRGFVERGRLEHLLCRNSFLGGRGCCFLLGLPISFFCRHFYSSRCFYYGRRVGLRLVDIEGGRELMGGGLDGMEGGTVVESADACNRIEKQMSKNFFDGF